MNALSAFRGELPSNSMVLPTNSEEVHTKPEELPTERREPASNPDSGVRTRSAARVRPSDSVQSANKRQRVNHEHAYAPLRQMLQHHVEEPVDEGAKHLEAVSPEVAMVQQDDRDQSIQQGHEEESMQQAHLEQSMQPAQSHQERSMQQAHQDRDSAYDVTPGIERIITQVSESAHQNSTASMDENAVETAGGTTGQGFFKAFATSQARQDSVDTSAAASAAHRASLVLRNDSGHDLKARAESTEDEKVEIAAPLRLRIWLRFREVADRSVVIVDVSMSIQVVFDVVQ